MARLGARDLSSSSRSTSWLGFIFLIYTTERVNSCSLRAFHMTF